MKKKKTIVIPSNVEYDGRSIKLKIDDKNAWLDELKKKQKEILEDMEKRKAEPEQFIGVEVEP